MATEIIKPGDKIHIVVADQRGNSGTKNASSDVFESQIYDIAEDGKIQIAIPIKNGKMKLFPVGQKLEAFFYGKGTRRMALLQVISRGNDDGLNCITCRLLTKVKSLQRRAYFRLTKTMGVEYYIWDGYEEGMSEKEALEACRKYVPETVMDAVTIDISGGGMKLFMKSKLEKGQHLMLGFVLIINGQPENFMLMGRVIESQLIPNTKSKYVTRVKFIGIKAEIREKIIGYIFIEERKHIKGEN